MHKSLHLPIGEDKRKGRFFFVFKAFGTATVAASTGSACHAGEHTPNTTLLAMGVSPEIALGAVRLSLGRASTRAEIEAAVELLAGAHGALVATTPSPTSLSTSKGTPR
jgi:cysteine sulfinate desulfinase/cysteine desulfurase-like protein